MRTLHNRLGLLVGVLSALALGGCSSLLQESAEVASGIASAAIADAVTDDPSVTAGIGIGANAAASAGVRSLQKRIHQTQQDQIATAAGPLGVGDIARWSALPVRQQAGERGQVTVARLIQAPSIDCKEIVFSVEKGRRDQPTAGFYTTVICRRGELWKWAGAEPATQRWGALQ